MSLFYLDYKLPNRNPRKKLNGDNVFISAEMFYLFLQHRTPKNKFKKFRVQSFIFFRLSLKDFRNIILMQKSNIPNISFAIENQVFVRNFQK